MVHDVVGEEAQEHAAKVGGGPLYDKSLPQPRRWEKSWMSELVVHKLPVEIPGLHFDNWCSLSPVLGKEKML